MDCDTNIMLRLLRRMTSRYFSISILARCVLRPKGRIARRKITLGLVSLLHGRLATVRMGFLVAATRYFAEALAFTMVPGRPRTRYSRSKAIESARRSRAVRCSRFPQIFQA